MDSMAGKIMTSYLFGFSYVMANSIDGSVEKVLDNVPLKYIVLGRIDLYRTVASISYNKVCTREDVEAIPLSVFFLDNIFDGRVRVNYMYGFHRNINYMGVYFRIASDNIDIQYSENFSKKGIPIIYPYDFFRKHYIYLRMLKYTIQVDPKPIVRMIDHMRREVPYATQRSHKTGRALISYITRVPGTQKFLILTYSPRLVLGIVRDRYFLSIKEDNDYHAWIASKEIVEDLIKGQTVFGEKLGTIERIISYLNELATPAKIRKEYFEKTLKLMIDFSNKLGAVLLRTYKGETNE